jgi:hypothetical protein
MRPAGYCSFELLTEGVRLYVGMKCRSSKKMKGYRHVTLPSQPMTKLGEVPPTNINAESLWALRDAVRRIDECWRGTTT